MAVLDDFAKLFDLAYKVQHGTAGVDRIHGRLVRTALVHRAFVWIVIQFHGLVE